MFMGLAIVLLVANVVCFVAMEYTDEDKWGVCVIIGFVLLLVVLILGSLHGFINYPKTEGTHQGVITAVDLEGVYFRRYEVYLKSSGYTNQSDETKYLIYDYENDLAEQLKSLIGQQVKLHYGHDGGYIGWKSCGTYHIKSVEKVEE